MLQLHVNGEALLRTETGGSNSARSYEVLGVSTDGVAVSIRTLDEPVFTDTFGPLATFDEQQFLMDAVLRLRLIFWEELVLQKLRDRPAMYMGLPAGGLGQDGLCGSAGLLWGAGLGGSNGPMYFGVHVDSPREGLPFTFPHCRVMDAQDVKLGTRVSAWDLTFHAVPYTGQAGDTATGGHETRVYYRG